MAEIGLELNRIRQISEEIKGLDQSLISGHFGELDGVLQRLQLILRDDGNVYDTVVRIARNATAISGEIKGSLKSLEVFIDQQIAEYERTDETAYQRLSAILERMSKLLGINFSKLNIDSVSSVTAPSAITGLNGRTSKGTYVTTGADYSGAATPFVAAVGAGAMAVGGARTNYGAPYYDSDQINALRNGNFAGNMQVNTPTKVTPEPITYPADSIPSLTKVYTVGPDGNNTIVWVGEDKQIYDANGNLMTSMYMTKKGAIFQTSIMENFVNMSDKDKYERYRWLYANQNGLRYEQVKDEYLTPEFKAKCDSGLINEYMPDDSTDLQAAKDFRKYADTLVPGSGGNIDAQGNVISPEGVNRPVDTPDKPVFGNINDDGNIHPKGADRPSDIESEVVSDNKQAGSASENIDRVNVNNTKNNYGPPMYNNSYSNAEIRGNFILENGKPVGRIDPVTGRVTDFQGRPINISNGIGKYLGTQNRFAGTMNNPAAGSNRPINAINTAAGAATTNPAVNMNGTGTNGGNNANYKGNGLNNNGAQSTPNISIKTPTGETKALNPKTGQFEGPNTVGLGAQGPIKGSAPSNVNVKTPTGDMKTLNPKTGQFEGPNTVGLGAQGPIKGSAPSNVSIKTPTGQSMTIDPTSGRLVSHNAQVAGINAMFK